MVRSDVLVGLAATSLGLATLNLFANLELRADRDPSSVAETVARPATPARAPVKRPVIAKVGSNESTAARPSELRVNENEQLLVVTGRDFEMGLTATLIAPLGLTTTFPATALAGLTSSSFKLAVMLDEPGTYLFAVRSADGVRSPPAQIVVKR